MKSKWLYTIAITAIITFGFFAVLKANYTPQPIEVMKVTHFERPEQIGIVTFRRFYYPIETQKIVAFGIPDSPEYHREMVRGFLEAAMAENVPFDVILSQDGMDALNLSQFPKLEVVKLNMNTATQAEMIDKIKELRAADKRILIYAPNTYTTHVIGGNVITRYEKATGEKILSISTAPLATAPNQERLVDPPCVGSERDNAGTNSLGCQIAQAGRMLYRKNIELKDYVAIMNSTIPDDFLLMVADPTQKRIAGQ